MFKKLHRLSATVVGSFILMHLVNHLCILGGADTHIQTMEVLRRIYRVGLIESVLLACVLFQVLRGFYFVWKTWRKRLGLLERAHLISVIYLAFFLINHVGAVLFGRLGLEIDTNVYFGIAGLHASPYQLFFFPYYLLAIITAFVLLANAYQRSRHSSARLVKQNTISFCIIGFGIVLSTILLMALSGSFIEIDIPVEYRHD